MSRCVLARVRSHCWPPHPACTQPNSADNETDDQALSDEAWHALQANIGEWERGRAQELAAAGVDGLEALAAAVGDAPDDGRPQDSAANTSTLDVDVHKLSAVLLQSVPRVGEQ